MCGIVGIFGGKIEEHMLSNMCDTISHRGPDGEGFWISNDKLVGLGHRRLSILDLSSKASQPMFTSDGSICVTFNGEIYNHKLLRIELQNLGAHFKTESSDTEVLIHGYMAWGLMGLLNKLEGMFAFALYDNKEKQLFLIRDRIGIKPLYFTKLDNNQIIFASEIKAILSYPFITREMDPLALYHYLTFMVSPAPMTMFKGIYKLPPANMLAISRDGSIKMERWWDASSNNNLDLNINNLTELETSEYYISELKTTLKQSVTKHLMSDVPMGVFLSGGIDSTTILALMAESSKDPINTFSVGYADHPHMNELEHAQMAANVYGAKHHEILISDKEVLNCIKPLIHHQDEPLADWVCIPLYFVSQLAKSSGVKVVQVGEGSDEQFFGYSHYVNNLEFYTRYWKKYLKLPTKIRNLVSTLTNAVAGMQPKLAPHADIFSRAAKNGEMFWTGAIVFWETMKKQIISMNKFHDSNENLFAKKINTQNMFSQDFFAMDSSQVMNNIYNRFDNNNIDQEQMTRMIYSEFQLRLPELLLMRVDKMTMAHSLEARVPFLDHKLIELTMNIPNRYKVRDGQTKWILKEAVKNLIPDNIIQRPKQGFGAPVSNWLRGEIGQHIEDTILGSALFQQGWFQESSIRNLVNSHRKGRSDRAVQIWTLFNLVCWYEYWIKG